MITRFFSKAKDGGPDSTVDGYFLIEIKKWFSIVLLRFNPGSRENFHSHAFNAYTWFIKGNLVEETVHGLDTGNVSVSLKRYKRSLLPKITKRDTLHKVHCTPTKLFTGSSWALSIRGPWRDTWVEVDRLGNKITLTHNRKVL